MDARTWLGLEPTHNPIRWVLPVTPGISTAAPFLCGGCALGAAIAALEHTGQRAVIWASAQYLSYARPPSILDIDVTLAATGKHVTQARVVGHVGDTETLTVSAALGTRGQQAENVWVTRSDAPRPDDCPVRPPRLSTGESIHDRIDVRLARARPWEDVEGHPASEGRSSAWARMPDLLDLSSGASLAILGDYVPFGISQALGWPGAGTAASTTHCGRIGWCRRNGCSSTSASMPSPTGSDMASSTSGPRTAPCWPRPASRPSSGSAANDACDSIRSCSAMA
jgi:acyl-CoA thioesterase II